jgi:hypothetical protein
MWKVLAHKLYKLVNEFIVGLSADAFFWPSLSCIKTQKSNKVIIGNVTHNVEMVIEEAFVVCANVKSDA